METSIKDLMLSVADSFSTQDDKIEAEIIKTEKKFFQLLKDKIEEDLKRIVIPENFKASFNTWKKEFAPDASVVVTDMRSETTKNISYYLIIRNKLDCDSYFKYLYNVANNHTRLETSLKDFAKENNLHKVLLEEVERSIDKTKFTGSVEAYDLQYTIYTEISTEEFNRLCLNGKINFVK